MRRTIPVLLFVASVCGFLSQWLAADEGEYAPPDALIDGVVYVDNEAVRSKDMVPPIDNQ